jgi:hypothetical protein
MEEKGKGKGGERLGQREAVWCVVERDLVVNLL